MRHQSKTFISKFITKTGRVGEVLEVGSRNDEGNIKHELGDFVSYIGTDMTAGANVDVVVNGHDLVKKFGTNKFDTVICLDTLEHDEEFWLTVEQIKKVLKPEGYMVLGAPGRAAPLHNHPDDYWRFMPSGFQSLFKDMDDVFIDVEYQPESYLNNQIEAEIYGWGKKK